jgi:hypothetical protein
MNDYLVDLEADLEYYRKLLARSFPGDTKAEQRVALLEDAAVVYRLRRPPSSVAFHQIPDSMLVQVFMAKFYG